jgi:uncharacterized membrane protein YhhN
MDLQVVFLSLFGIISAVYLTTLAFKPGILQYILKSCLMPILLVVYIYGVGSNNVFLPVIAALVFAWIGDVLLVKINNISCFKFGLASFLIGHLFYIVSMYRLIDSFHIPAFLVSVLIAACFCVIAFKAVKPSKEMKIPVIAYEMIIMLLAIFACQLFMAQNSAFGVLVFAGSLCFVVSDTFFALETFRGYKIYFWAMLTYISAQILIILGFCAL